MKMKKITRINDILWKEGPLLPGLLTCKHSSE